MIRLSKPNILEDSIARVSEVLRSGNLVQGQNVELLEAAVQNYLGISNAIVVSSGTAALHLALLALDIKSNEEVIVPAFTFPATVNVVELCNATPVLIDVSLNDFNIQATDIEKRITDRTKAIMPVHEFGCPADMQNILKIAQKYNLAVIEDAACALGAEINGKKIGTFGHIGCFSLHPRKSITTGEGGIIVTNDNELAQKCRALRNHGIVKKDNSINFKYAGLNYRMTEFQAVLGYDQMQKIDTVISKHINCASKYQKELSEINWLKCPGPNDNIKHTFQTFHLLLDKSMNRSKLFQYMRDSNIEVNIGAQAIHCLEYYRDKYAYHKNDYINAETAYLQGMAVPIGPHLSDDDITDIIKALKNYRP